MRKNKSERTSASQSPEAPLVEAAASGAEVVEVNLAYIGPDYSHGIKIHGEPQLVRPREMSAAEVARFLERHPNRSNWWMPEEKL